MTTNLKMIQFLGVAGRKNQKERMDGGNHNPMIHIMLDQLDVISREVHITSVLAGTDKIATAIFTDMIAPLMKRRSQSTFPLMLSVVSLVGAARKFVNYKIKLTPGLKYIVFLYIILKNLYVLFQVMKDMSDGSTIPVQILGSSERQKHAEQLINEIMSENNSYSSQPKNARLDAVTSNTETDVGQIDWGAVIKESVGYLFKICISDSTNVVFLIH